MIFSDLELARRLEGAEANANARFVEARARVQPDVQARWIEVGGAYAMYDGVRSPCTQSFGLGMFQTPRSADLDEIETFFRSRGAPVMHEVSPLAAKETWALMGERRYRPVEFSSVLFRPLGAEAMTVESDPRVEVRVAGPAEHETWAKVVYEGWRQHIDFADLILDLARVTAARDNSPLFLAELDGTPVAGGALALHGEVAILAGAATVPAARRQGAQNALLHARLRYAREAGCDIAMICAEPGSASQRNAERQGFRIAYTRTKWELPSDAERRPEL
ncbi:MAG TPA: GNAT family N-acetyltransferase [Bryobacteraceae bacterium]|nr:GNAT family N-acetyltransferase [Bryobacteraceae bacterium]